MHMPTYRVIKILESIRNSEDGLNLTEISEETEIPKSTLSPILKTLIETNFVEMKGSKYLIGFGAYKIANAYNYRSDALSIIRSYMKDIVRECNEICQLGVYENEMVFYIAKEEPKRAIKIVSSVGTRIAANAPALGKALLTQFDDDYIIKNFRDNMVKYTDKTAVCIERLLEQVHSVRNRGYALELGEIDEDIRCVAIPLSIDGKVVAALSISIPIYRADDANLNKCRDVLLKYKCIIETALSGMDINF